MTENAEDPFEQFAKAMASSEEVVNKIREETPPAPTSTMTDQEKIDLYVEFERWAKERKAAESALMKSMRKMYSEAINPVLDRNHYPAEYTTTGKIMWPMPGTPEVPITIHVPTPTGVRAVSNQLTGKKHSLVVSYNGSPNWNEGRLREIDMAYSSSVASSVSMVPPPPAGIKVKYSADASKAVDPTIGEAIANTIESHTFTRKLTPVFGGAEPGEAE